MSELPSTHIGSVPKDTYFASQKMGLPRNWLGFVTYGLGCVA